MKRKMPPAVHRRDYEDKEKAELLEQTNWSDDFSWPQIEYMASYFETYDVPPETIILYEGNKQPPYMGLIIEGRVRISKIDVEGNKKNLAFISKGKTFGEMSLIDGLPSSASVITETDVTLMVLSYDSYLKLIDDNSAAACQFLSKLARLMSARLRETSCKLVDFLEKD